MIKVPATHEINILITEADLHILYNILYIETGLNGDNQVISHSLTQEDFHKTQ